jgi:phosphomannomutase
MVKFDEQVFKPNDIRGIYPHQLHEGFAFMLGVAVVKQFGVKRIVIGRDCRLSSPGLYAALACGIKSAGGEVGAADLCPMEIIYYIMGSRSDFDFGIMVTASHNPPQYNGFKLFGRGVRPIDEREGLSRLRPLIETATAPVPDKFTSPPKNLSFETECVRFALKAAGVQDVPRLKVVVDPGNGTGGLLWGALADVAGVRPIAMNFEPDGRFPSHHPNPARLANLEPLKGRVLAEGADIGFAYDGDADRTVAVLSDGHVLDGSAMIVALVERLFAGRPSARCAVNMVTSRKTLDYLRARGQEPLMAPVGHAKIKRAMQAHPDVGFAGEQSGHYLYREFFCCESSLVTSLHLMHLVACGRLASLVGEMPGPWFGPRREPEFRFVQRAEALATCRAATMAGLKEFPGPQEIMCEWNAEVHRRCKPADIAQADGVRVDYEDWWFSMRPSGTEPIARLAIEARSKTELQAKRRALVSLFEASRTA